MPPDLFIVGDPKCGTSAMHQYLAAHPQIYMAKKEMHTFGSDLRFGPQFYRRTVQEYIAEFERRDRQPHAGEASVWDLLHASRLRNPRLQPGGAHYYHAP